MSTAITASIERKSHFLQPVTVYFLLLLTCGWYYGPPGFHWAALRSLAQTGKKCSTVSLPSSSNDNRLHSHLLVIPTWQCLSFLKRSQSFFPMFAFHSFKAQPSTNSRKVLLEKQNPKAFRLCWSWFLNFNLFQNLITSFRASLALDSVGHTKILYRMWDQKHFFLC